MQDNLYYIADQCDFMYLELIAQLWAESGNDFYACPLACFNFDPPLFVFYLAFIEPEMMMIEFKSENKRFLYSFFIIIIYEKKFLSC